MIRALIRSNSCHCAIILFIIIYSLYRAVLYTHTFSCSGRAHISASCIFGMRVCAYYVCVYFLRDVQQLVLELLVKTGSLTYVYLCMPFLHVYVFCASLDDQNRGASGITTKSSHNTLVSLQSKSPPEPMSAPIDCKKKKKKKIRAQPLSSQ